MYKKTYVNVEENFDVLGSIRSIKDSIRGSVNGLFNRTTTNLMGPQGPIGPIGPQGLQGPMGFRGPEGPMGPQGLKGDKGDTGDRGLQGERGPVGPTGSAGPQGPQGIQGLKGDKGDTGERGPIGLTGIQGPRGDTGAVGPKGDTGDTGPRGLMGLTGPMGPSGAKGDKGDKGDTGPPLRYGAYNMPISVMEPVFGPPVYLWEGYNPITTTSDIVTRLTLKGTATLNNTHYSATWKPNGVDSKRFMMGLNNTTFTNNKPTSAQNYVVIKLPVDVNTHNAVFIQTVTIDRWSNINMCICDPIDKVPVKRLQTNVNSAWIVSNTLTDKYGINRGNSSFLGPANQNAYQNYYEWLQFNIPYEYISTYRNQAGEVFVSINSGINGTADLWVSGVAVCPNPYGLSTLRALNAYWQSNGETGDKVIPHDDSTTIINNPNGFWNEEYLGKLLAGKVYNIKVPVANRNQSMIIGYIAHNNSWHDGNCQIFLENDANKYYELSPLIIGRFGTSLLGRNLYRHPKGIYLPASVVSQVVKADANGYMYILLKIDMTKQVHNMYTRGFYSETVEPLV